MRSLEKSSDALPKCELINQLSGENFFYLRALFYDKGSKN